MTKLITGGPPCPFHVLERQSAEAVFLHAETALPVGGDSIFKATKPVVSIKCIKNIAGSFIGRND